MLSLFSYGGHGSLVPSQELGYTADAIPALPPQKDETTYWNPWAWTVRFTGFLCYLGAPLELDLRATAVAGDHHLSSVSRNGPELDDEVVITSETQTPTYLSATTLRYTEQLFEVSHTRLDGNCLFASVSSVIYGDWHFWPHVKAQHKIWLEHVLSNPEHPRYASYRKWADDESDSHSNRDRLLAVGFFQSATILQLAADLYGVTFVVLEPVFAEEAGTRDYDACPPPGFQRQRFRLLDNGQHILRVAALFGDPHDPPRFVFFHMDHFEAARPRIDLPARTSDYCLPAVFHSAPRPWKLLRYNGDDNPRRLISRPVLPDPSNEEIKAAAGSFIRVTKPTPISKPSDDVQSASSAPRVSPKPQQRMDGPIGLAHRPASAPSHARRIPRSDRDTLTRWRHRTQSPDRFWRKSCGFVGRQSDVVSDRRLLENLSPSDKVAALVQDVQTLEMEMLDYEPQDSRVRSGVKGLMRRTMALRVSQEDDFPAFSRVMNRRMLRLEKAPPPVASRSYAVALEHAIGSSQSEKLHLALKLGLYLYVRFRLHHTTYHLKTPELDEYVSELRAHVSS